MVNILQSNYIGNSKRTNTSEFIFFQRTFLHYIFYEHFERIHRFCSGSTELLLKLFLDHMHHSPPIKSLYN